MGNWEQLLQTLLKNADGVTIIMSFVIFALTFAVKLPFKLLFAKVIKNERGKEWAERVIVSIPFGLAFLLRFVCNQIGFVAMTEMNAITAGATSIALYNVFKTLLKKKGVKVKVDVIDETLSKDEVFNRLCKSISEKNEKK